ncbi:MAG: hypothetical protein ACRDRH_08055 [Pseudonocardia sp.]
MTIRTVTATGTDAVRQQVDAGVDVVTAGELSQVGFLTCVEDRLAGDRRHPRDTEFGWDESDQPTAASGTRSGTEVEPLQVDQLDIGPITR